MKFGLFTVSSPEFEPFELMEKAAEIGYDGIEWRVTEDEGDRSKPSFWSGNRAGMTADEMIEQADKLKAKAGSLGLEMPSVGAYIDCSDAGQVELHLKAAQVLGAKAIRIGPGKYDSQAGPYQEQIDKAKAQYVKVAELAKKYGVRALIETHMSQLAPSVTKAMAILKGLDPACVGIMWDPANQVFEGIEDYEMAISIAGDYLGEVHVKNTIYRKTETENGQDIWQAGACPVNEGIVNWPKVVDVLKRNNYNGWVFFEDFSTELPTLERLKFNLSWFKGLL